MDKWQLLKFEDVSPSEWFPVERREYKRPDGKLVDNFYITTLADSVHIITITEDKKVVMIKMYKQGIDDIMIQFPAGRYEPMKHQNYKDCAATELEEETGIRVPVSGLKKVGKLALMSTKATESAHVFIVKSAKFNSKQRLDANEEIEILTLDPYEIDQKIKSGEIWDSPCIAAWNIAKLKYSELLDL